MRQMLAKLRDMSKIARFVLKTGLALGTLLHIAAIAAIGISGLDGINSCYALDFAACMRETGVAVFFVAVAGSALLEENVHKS